MGDFVHDKLNQWGLSEWIKNFKDHNIDKESFYDLEDDDVNTLIPLVGPARKFKKKLKKLKEEQNAKEGACPLSVQSPWQHEEAVEVIKASPSTSNTGKRKLDLQLQTPSKRLCENRASSEAIILSKVKAVMECVYDKLRKQDNVKLGAFLEKKILDLETNKRELVGVFGKTGAGKSSLINAVIEQKKLLPSGKIRACTSVMIKVEANMHSQKYEAEIEFITLEEWKEELWSLNQFQRDDEDQEQDEELAEKLSTLYGDEWKGKSPESLLDNKFLKEIRGFFSFKKPLTCESAEKLSAELEKYTRNDRSKGDTARQYWPLVKCVTVRVPQNDLLQHVTLVDLPGNGDRNKTRDQMWKGIIENCSTVWIVADINRAASDKEAWEILENACPLLGNGGECQRIHFICTKSDNKDSDDTVADLLKRNRDIKEELFREFKKQPKIKKHFREDCFEVFTVSSSEFLQGKLLDQEQTEIPNLQAFLKELNDCHSKTLKYVTGAHGILSLMEGARRDEAAGQKTQVYEELLKNITLNSIKTRMDEAYTALERCLTGGVEESKSSCDITLESFLYPEGKDGRGFHKILRCVVNNNGTHKPKKGKQLNLNMNLASSLTNSIDKDFKETFPNDGKSRPFSGAINEFSLDTDGLIQKYKDVELQLIFLKTEEEKIKTKLNKDIRDRKKAIYLSLMETIEKKMEDCYQNAAEIKGKASLQNMRDTIERHVKNSKNTMFDQAKDEMLKQLKDLMEHVLKTLEEEMKESVKYSLKTEGHSIPDVSKEYKKVQKLYNELKTSSNI